MVRVGGRTGRPNRLHHAAARRRLVAARRPQPQKEAALAVDADVVEALPNAMFTLQLAGGHRLIGYVSGRMQHGHARVTTGDRVRVEITPYDLTRGRIVGRCTTHVAEAA